MSRSVPHPLGWSIPVPPVTPTNSVLRLPTRSADGKTVRRGPGLLLHLLLERSPTAWAPQLSSSSLPRPNWRGRAGPRSSWAQVSVLLRHLPSLLSGWGSHLPLMGVSTWGLWLSLALLVPIDWPAARLHRVCWRESGHNGGLGFHGFTGGDPSSEPMPRAMKGRRTSRFSWAPSSILLSRRSSLLSSFSCKASGCPDVTVQLTQTTLLCVERVLIAYQGPGIPQVLAWL